MGIAMITPFDNIDIAKNATEYSPFFSMKDLFYGITDQEFGAHLEANSSTTSTSVTVTAEGSFDGVQVDTGVAVFSTVNIGDGAPDYAAFNLGKPYPFVRFKAVENNTNPVVDLLLYVSYPTSERVR